MPPPLFRVMENGALKLEAPLTGAMDLGRQRADEPEPYQILAATAPGVSRVVIARLEESNISRQHVHFQPLPTGLVRVTNRSQRPLSYQGASTPLGANASIDLAPPFSFFLGARTLTVAHAHVPAPPADLLTLDGRTFAPGRIPNLSRELRPLPSLNPFQLDELIGWLQTTMGVLQSVVGAADFLPKATQALVEIVGLDSGRVLLLQKNEWKVEAVHGGTPEEQARWQPSQRVLSLILEEKRTFWQTPQQAGAADTPSLQDVHTAVASPLLDGDGRVIGALYGERRQQALQGATAGGKLEAMLVELLACGLSAGLALQEQQGVALKAHAQFEQFFTPQLAQQLREEPDLLEGREAAVTLLFCDVRAFSRISARLGPSGTVRWIGDVMSELSKCVLAQEGVLVDYIGDELMAMWGAPRPQEEQASLAVDAALAMRDALVILNERWEPKLGEAIDVGIGINSGIVQVGNTGSIFKFKYGPLGNTVNLASRVQGLTKYLRVPLLVTAATRQQLDDRFIARRISKVRVMGIADPLDIHEVERATTPERAQFFHASEAALTALEAGEFAQAARQAGALLHENSDDGPLLLVLSRAAQMLMDKHAAFEAPWEPPGK